MTLRYIKLFFGIFILVAYVSIGVFGLFQFNHITEEPMVNCPYSDNGFSLCDNSLQHVKNWHQFSSVVFPLIFVLSLLFFGAVVYFFSNHNFLNQKQYFYKWKYYLDNKKLDTYTKKIIKWLSLLENSPSLSASVFL